MAASTRNTIRPIREDRSFPQCDVDEALLEKANRLRRLVQRGHISCPSVTRLSDIPLLLVSLFEIINGHVLPDQEKCVSRLSTTLQMILDTIQEVMRLPFNHVTGSGLVRNDRRQMDNALDIFTTLAETYLSKSRKGTWEEKLSMEDLSPAQHVSVEKQIKEPATNVRRQASTSSSRRTLRASVVSTKVRRHSSIDGNVTMASPESTGTLMKTMKTNLDKLIQRLEHLKKKKREIEQEEATINKQLEDLITTCQMARS